MTNTEETVVGIPVIVEPIEVELTLTIVIPQFRDITVQVDLGNRAPCIPSHLFHQYSKLRRTLSYLHSLHDLFLSLEGDTNSVFFGDNQNRYAGNNRNHCHSDLFCLRPTCFKP